MPNTMHRKLAFEEIHARQPNLDELQASPRHPVIVLGDDIRSLHNVGAIFRTSDAAHIQHLYLCGITGKPPRDEIRKTSLGAEESVPWSYEKDALVVIEKLRQQGYQICVLEHTTQSVNYQQTDYQFPLCLIIGNEYHGVNDELVAAADMAIELPMHGIKQSLNVSVAYGVAVYHLISLCKKRK